MFDHFLDGKVVNLGVNYCLSNNCLVSALLGVHAHFAFKEVSNVLEYHLSRIPIIILQALASKLALIYDRQCLWPPILIDQGILKSLATISLRG